MGSENQGRSRLKLTNTLHRKKEIFRSREPGKVRLFTCGPSIYSRPHVGNYRTFLFEDVLQRHLEYCGYQVDRVINFTDVEDKAIAEARDKAKRLREITEPVADRFFQEAKALRIKLPRRIPRSSTSVPQAVELIKILLKKGYAYWHGGDVFYDPLTFKGFGKLFGLDMTRWPKRKVRFRKDTYAGNRWNLGDFILWHGGTSDSDPDVTWDTDLGRGRPSWNIQDPAMITKHLGYEIDIACGGVDNLYRHHDYTIAVMEAMSGRRFSNYWLHGEHVLVDGSKMSKSKGNIVHVEDVVQGGYTPEQLRFFLIYPHYRQRVNLTPTKIARAARKLDEVNRAAGQLTDLRRRSNTSHPDAAKHIRAISNGFETGMNDDLNVKAAVENIRGALKKLRHLDHNEHLSKEDRVDIRRALKSVNRVLQVFE
jgi:cysteinyl-tRNA synthetase